MSIFRPFTRLVMVSILGRRVRVPENNFLLRGFQYLCPKTIPYGSFCWNETCQNCRIHYRGPGEGKTRIGLSCKLMANEGMEIRGLAPELEHLLARILPARKD